MTKPLAKGDFARLVSPKPDLSLDDFVAYMPMHNYVFKTTRETWPASSVDARIPPVVLRDSQGKPILDNQGKPKKIAASAWLDRYSAVEQATWVPGKPMLIDGKILSHGGWIDALECTLFNFYRPPTIMHRPGDVSLWLDHIRKLYPDYADTRIIPWLAHRVQRPWEKINHALVLLGNQGVGKDTLLEPVKAAIGPWNFSEASPAQVLGRFNGFLKSVILRLSEAREIVDASRSPEDAEFADTLDALGNPNAVTLVQIKNNTNSTEFHEWLSDRKNARKIPHRMEACGYEPMRNKDADDGLWKISGKRQVIYVKRELNEHDRHKAKEELS
jgi:hypothetical protein